VIRELEWGRHPETDQPIVEKAYRREEVYQGPCLEWAPDIVVKWALHRGYSYAFKSSFKAPGKDWLEHIDPKTPESQRFFTGKSGTHRDDGIFLARGRDIRAGSRVEGAGIIDLAPTLLHMLGVSVPDDMDGRVLTEIFTTAPQPAPAWQRPAPAQLVPKITCDSYSAEDEEKIGQRLRSLGYIE